MACFAPEARAICVTALPTDPPIAGDRTVLPARKPARVRATCAVRYATGIPAALTSSILSGIRQGLPSVRQPTHCRFHPQKRHRRRRTSRAIRRESPFHLRPPPHPLLHFRGLTAVLEGR